LARPVGFEAKKPGGIAVHSHTSVAERSEKPAASAQTVVDADTVGPGVGPADPVEAALAHALTKAAEAGRFDVVAQLARELEARRLAQEPNVVALTVSRGTRAPRSAS